MTKHEVNALATRFKSTALLLMHCDLMEIEEIETAIEISHTLFDSQQYEESKKIMDLLDSLIVDILEIPEPHLN